MQKYVQLLLDDMLIARRKENKNTKRSFNLLEESFEDLEAYISDRVSKEIRLIIGFEQEQFPPKDFLTIQQIKQIAQGFEKLLYSWNIVIDLPKSIPTPKRYDLLLSTLNWKVSPLKYGFVHLEFCVYDHSACPLGTEYCACQHFHQDADFYLSSGIDENDDLGNLLN